MPSFAPLSSHVTETISLLSEVAPPMLDAELPSGHCVPGTRIGLDVLQHFGVNGFACPTRVAAGDALGFKVLDALTRGGEIPSLKRLPCLKMCGISSPFETTYHHGEYDRHLLIVAENRILVDLTAGFFSHERAPIPSAVVYGVDDAFLTGRRQLVLSFGKRSTIRYRSDASDRSHETFRSWERGPMTRDLTRRIIAEITSRLTPPGSDLSSEPARCA